MANYYRQCAGGVFNSGTSNCPFDPGHIKAIILVEHGQKLPATITASSLQVACHADRPARIYPLKEVVEFAPEGGEVQTSENGYGGSKITGYSAYSPTFTMADADLNLRKQIVTAKAAAFDAYFVDDNNVIYGYKAANGDFLGVALNGVGAGGALWDSSGDSAQLTAQIFVRDYEGWMRNILVQQLDFDVLSALTGLVFVHFDSVTGGYKLVSDADNLDLTSYYGALLTTNAATAMPSATAVSYDAATNVVSITGTAQLAAPSVLQTVGILGIEQNVAV